MNSDPNIQPLGKILRSAGLISEAQLEVALYDRICYQEMRIGEILVSRGWIKSITADFFAEEWEKAIKAVEKYPLGFYLQKAGLLDSKQTEIILQEQPRSLIRFGSVAVLKGWLEQRTLDFFLHNLFPQEAAKSSLNKQYIDAITMTELPYSRDIDYIMDKERDERETLFDEIDYEDIPWID